MTTEALILDYTNKYYLEENKLIERSMVNYYHLRLKKDKTDIEINHQEKIFNGVLELFNLLSLELANKLNMDKDIILTHLKNIHIKT